MGCPASRSTKDSHRGGLRDKNETGGPVESDGFGGKRPLQAGGRTDLVEKEQTEIEILKSFLPQPISQEEILRIIDQSIEETQASSLKDLGKVMKSVMPKLGGKADGKLINQLVRERLSP